MTQPVAPLAGANDFARWFTDVWTLPKPGPFSAAILAAVTDDVRSTQPLFPDAVGPQAFVAIFHRLFRLLPDMTASIDSCVVAGPEVILTATCRGTAGGKPLTFHVSDHFTLRDDRIARRVTFADPTEVLKQVALRPKAWPGALRMQFGPG